jgi:signal transduction histidine kinase/CheY-like chemotaxis protein
MIRAPRVALLVWLIVGLFAVCVVGVAAWLLQQIDAETQRAARAQAQSLTRSAETTLNRHFIAFDLTLAGLPQTPGLYADDGRTLDPTHAATVLRALVSHSLLLRNLFLVDLQGAVATAADAATQRLGSGLPEGFLAAVLQQPVPQLAISAPATDFATGEKVLYVARRVAAPSAGGTRHVAVAVVPVSALSTLLAPAVDITGLGIAVETDDGLLLANVPANDSQLGRMRPWLPAAARGDGEAALMPGRLDGEPAYAVTRPTVYASLQVTAGIAEAAVVAQAREARLTTLAIAAAFIGVAVVIGAAAQTYLARLTAATNETAMAKSVLDQALASVDEGFLLWDADHRALSWNERYLALFPHLRSVIRRGIGMEEMAQAAAAVMVPGGNALQRQAWVEEAMSRYQADGREIEQHLPDGRVVSVVDRRMATGGIVSVYRDVTQQRTAANELERARAAAEAANEAKTRFLATMSHEIRTPLNGVLGMNGLLLQTPLNARQRLYAETIRSSGETLLTIINDILDMSKLEAGRMEVELSDFDPEALVGDVVGLLRAQATVKGLALRQDPGPVVAGLLSGDAGRLRQVLFNLVGNAIKFTERGSVAVQAAQTPRDDGRVDWTLRVRDTGIGIAAGALPQLFQRFVQADSSTSRRFGGSGLGLAITRELVELMGGRVEVDSHLGQGSEFRVTLPLLRARAQALPGPTAVSAPPGPGVAAAAPAIARAPADAPAAAAEDAPAQVPAGLRVLVAEDNRVNQLVLEAMLQRMGCFVDVVFDGAEALRQVQQAPYDLVLMDIQMPNMDGVAATRAIRQLPGRTGRVPIVSVSANVLPEQRACYLEAGMNDHVAKPIELPRLAAAINSAVRFADAA